jgi:multiple sugar transport system substrate-binding protein
MAERDDIIIEWVDLGSVGEEIQATMALVRANEAPDIFYINERVFAYAELGILRPLNDLISRDNFGTSGFYEGLMAANTREGEVYAFPQEVSPFVMYYNKDMFEKYGVPLPHDDWTQDEFYAAAKALTRPGDGIHGYQHWSGWADQQLGWFLRAGVVDVFRDDYSTVNFDGPESLEALRFIRDMVVVDKVSPSPAEAQAMGFGWYALFSNQQVAMNSAGLWMLPMYFDEPLEFNWDVVRMPKNKNQYTKAGVLNWGISSSSQHVDEAWEFIKYLVGPVGMKIVAESHMALPGSTDAAANKIIEDSAFPSNVKAFIDSAPYVNLSQSMSPKEIELMSVFNNELELMMMGEQSPEETQIAIVNKLNAILAED